MSFADELRKTTPNKTAFNEEKWISEYVNNCLDTIKECSRSNASHGLHKLAGYFKQSYDVETGWCCSFIESLYKQYGAYDMFYIIDNGGMTESTFKEVKRRIEEGIRALGFTNYSVNIEHKFITKEEEKPNIFGNMKRYKVTHKAAAIYLNVKW